MQWKIPPPMRTLPRMKKKLMRKRRQTQNCGVHLFRTHRMTLATEEELAGAAEKLETMMARVQPTARISSHPVLLFLCLSVPSFPPLFVSFLAATSVLVFWVLFWFLFGLEALRHANWPAPQTMPQEYLRVRRLDALGHLAATHFRSLVVCSVVRLCFLFVFVSFSPLRRLRSSWVRSSHQGTVFPLRNTLRPSIDPPAITAFGRSVFSNSLVV